MKYIKIYLNFISFIIITTTTILACSEDERTVKIVDFTEPHSFAFIALNEPSRTDTNVVGGILFVKGEIHGEILISADGAGGGKLSGKIDTFFRNDLYVGHSTMSVKPIGQVKGELTITFRFSKI